MNGMAAASKLFLIVVVAFAAITLSFFVFTHWYANRIAGLHPPRGEFVETGEFRLHYTNVPPATPSAAAPGRRTIVLVHGASGNEADMRIPLADRLARQGYRVISFDRPGHGWSERGGENEASPASQARALRQALERLGERDVIVAGHSLAGAMTLQLALDHADIVRGVVLIAPVTHPWPGGIATYYSVAASPVAGPLFANTYVTPLALAVFDRSLQSVFSPQAPPEDYRARTGVDLVLRPPVFQANARDVAGMYDFVTREQKRYPQISVPVSIITGDSDAIVLTHIHSYGSARDIPGAQLHVLEGVGHSPHWVRPDEVAGLIDKFAAATFSARLAGR